MVLCQGDNSLVLPFCPDVQPSHPLHQSTRTKRNEPIDARSPLIAPTWRVTPGPSWNLCPRLASASRQWDNPARTSVTYPGQIADTMSGASAISTAADHPRRPLLRPLPAPIVRRITERSAARLAHQSGGLGVASSNLAAPTKFKSKINENLVPAMFSISRRLQPFTISR